MTPRILLLAGEVSGDRHGADVARALKALYPDCALAGLGGPCMRAEGVRLLAGLERLAVMGFVETFPRLPFLWRLGRRVRKLVSDGAVDLVLAVDYAGFNLRVARFARAKGIPVLYYVTPKVWAWGAGRTADLVACADRLAVILPFEVDVFRDAGDRVSFVGHPLLDQCPPEVSEEAFRAQWDLPPEGPLLALLPGSRPAEIGRHLGAFAEAAHIVRVTRPDVQPVLARAPSIPPAALRKAGFPIVEDARLLLRFARAALVKSGTGTLEAALECTPHVTVYRMHPLNYLLARLLVRIDHVALPNLVAGKPIVPELIQHEATPEHLAKHLDPLLDEASPERTRMVAALSGVRASLGSPGAAGRVANLAAELLNGRG